MPKLRHISQNATGISDLAVFSRFSPGNCLWIVSIFGALGAFGEVCAESDPNRLGTYANRLQFPG